MPGAKLYLSNYTHQKNKRLSGLFCTMSTMWATVNVSNSGGRLDEKNLRPSTDQEESAVETNKSTIVFILEKIHLLL